MQYVGYLLDIFHMLAGNYFFFLHNCGEVQRTMFPFEIFEVTI